MNEQLQQALAAIITKAISGIEAGANFLSSELPDVIHQLLLFKMVQASLISGGALIVLLASIFALVKALPVISKHSRGHHMYLTGRCGSDMEEEGRKLMQEVQGKHGISVALTCLAIPSTGFSAILFMHWAGTVLKIWLAPKIYLIEYAASLAK